MSVGLFKNQFRNEFSVDSLFFFLITNIKLIEPHFSLLQTADKVRRSAGWRKEKLEDPCSSVWKDGGHEMAV
jgi:hypothetical protein